mmetsp:Transcript_8563/g.21902  ORF Transcript_8563/g.21902 Transcript_8563/m.21902 type:complete len:188 (+) Transcript_8563:3-566(+)
MSSNGSCIECPTGCKDCQRAKEGSCFACSDGYRFDLTFRCVRCIEHCVQCNVTGLSTCDQCRTGYGFNATLSQCLPCDVDNCDKCGPDGRCEECAPGFGITPRGACDKCGYFCRSCGASSSCKWCDDTYVLKDGLCFSCGDRCASCATSGAGKCDVCLPGFIRDSVTWNCVHDDYANLMEELYEEEM